MQKLSSPFKLIGDSVKIFFDRKNLVYFILIYVFLTPFWVFQYLSESLNINLASGINIAINILYFAIYLFTSLAGILAVKKVVDRGAINFKETYASAFKNFWKYFLISVLVFLTSLGGFVLLIIPGVIFSTWFAFSIYVFVDQKLGVKASMSKSRSLVKGRFWAILGRLVVFGIITGFLGYAVSVVPYNIGSIVITLARALLVLPYYLLYRELSLR